MAEKSGKKSNRKNYSEDILQKLLQSGEIFVDELAKEMSVSPSTIRRSLTALENQGLLRRSHGGAVLVEQSLYEPFRNVSSFQEQEQQRSSEKRLIGLAAAELINDGDVIAIGAGTTTTQVARSIRHRKGITVVTNAVNIAMELSHREDLTVRLTGGQLSGAWFALVGTRAIAGMHEFFVDKCFIGVDGVDLENGLTTNYPDQAAIHRQMLKQACQKIVVADHQKIGKTGKALICPLSEIEILITDSKTPKNIVNQFLKKGLKVIKS